MSTPKNIALSVKNLTKRFKKGAQTITSLDAVSFDVYEGEIVGIVGKNGAGKSTLLKVLSKITGPTEGEIEYEGVLTSIIEIGTGFHADLSARENVYLGGALLGVSTKEMASRFDEIVAFSGLEAYMEMPIKHFSSGMYLRLAFSVAFHCPIDILLLDEVLAVGDLDFRRKCHEKIRHLSRSGVSIVMVSHNLEPILEFCDRCILLNAGRIEMIGNPTSVIESYVDLVNKNKDVAVNSALENKRNPDKLKQFDIFVKHQSQEDPIILKRLCVKATGKEEEAPILMRDSITLHLDCVKRSEEGSFEITFYINNLNGIRILQDSLALRHSYEVKDMPKGDYSVSCTIPGNLLNRGVYTLGILVSCNKKEEIEIEHATSFTIHVNPESQWQQKISAVIRPELDWVINHSSD